LWLNDNEIIWDADLGYENESTDQGRSHDDKNKVLLSRYSLFSGDGGVINVWGGSNSMNINFSIFYNCVCSSS